MRVRYSGFRGPGINMTPIWVIMGVNALVFVASMINQPLIYEHLGLHPITPWIPFDPGFFDQPWTIVTSMFVHAVSLPFPWHLLGNMLMLYFFGSYLLQLVGENKFLFVYFAGGLLGNILLLALASMNPFVVAMGASGALYAVMGAMAVMRPRLKVYLWFMIPVDLWIVVALGMLIIFPGVAWQAHLGGLALGLAAGFFFRKRERGAFRR